MPPVKKKELWSLLTYKSNDIKQHSYLPFTLGERKQSLQAMRREKCDKELVSAEQRHLARPHELNANECTTSVRALNQVSMASGVYLVIDQSVYPNN